VLEPESALGVDVWVGEGSDVHPALLSIAANTINIMNFMFDLLGFAKNPELSD